MSPRAHLYSRMVLLCHAKGSGGRAERGSGGGGAPEGAAGAHAITGMVPGAAIAAAEAMCAETTSGDEPTRRPRRCCRSRCPR